MDADLLELLHDERGALGLLRGVVADDADLEAVGVAGLLEQALGLLQVVLVRGLGLVAGHHLGQDGGRRGGGAGVHDLDVLVLVEGVVQGLAHLDVGERLVVGVERDVAHRRGLEGDHVDVAGGAHGGNLVGGHRVDGRGLARLEGGDAGAGLGDHAEVDAIDRGGLAPVVLVAKDAHVVALGVLLQDVGAGARGLLGVVPAGVGEGGGADEVELRHGVHEGRVGRGQVELDRVVVNGRAGVDADLLGVLVDGLDEHAATAPVVVLVDGGLVVGHDGGGVEGLAVGEGDALVQVEGVGAGVVGDVVGVCGARLELVVLVQVIERVVDVVHDVAGVAVGPVHRVHLLELALEGEDALVLGGLAVGVGGADDEALVVGLDELDRGRAGVAGVARAAAGAAGEAETRDRGASSRDGAHETAARHVELAVKLVVPHVRSSLRRPSSPVGRASCFGRQRQPICDGQLAQFSPFCDLIEYYAQIGYKREARNGERNLSPA